MKNGKNLDLTLEDSDSEPLTGNKISNGKPHHKRNSKSLLQNNTIDASK